MSSHRPVSPPGSRRLIPPGRTSAGSFFTGPPTYYDYSNRTNREYAPGSRSSAERIEAPRAIAVRPRSPPRRDHDEDFDIRPRPRTLSMDPEEQQKRRPLSLFDPRLSNKTGRPIVTKDSPVSASPSSKSGGAQLEASYIVPASSSSGRHHHRQSSLGTGDRLLPRDKNPRDRVYLGGSRGSDLSGGRSSVVRSNVSRERQGRDDRDYGYEYTNAKDQVLRDTAPRPRPRRESSTGVRPTSMIQLDRPEKHYLRSEKDVGPPVTSRGFDTIGRSESLKHPSRDDDLGRRESRRGYLLDEREDTRSGYPVRSSGATHHQAADEYIPYPEENVRHQRPRQPAIDDERAELRPPRRKLTLDDERPNLRPRDPAHRKPTLEEQRLEPKPRDPPDERHDRVGDDRSSRSHDKRNYRDEIHRNDFDDKDHKDHKDRRVRDEARDRRDKSSRNDEVELSNGVVGGGVAGAATVLAAEGVRRHHHKESRDEDGRASKDLHAHLREPDRDQASDSTSISGETHENESREERRRRRRREREREELYSEAREEERRTQLQQTQRPKDEELHPRDKEQQPMTGQLALSGKADPVLREQASYERQSDPNGNTRHNQHQDPRKPRHRRHHSHTRTEESYSDSSSSHSERSVDMGLRRARVVTPSNEMAPPPLPPAPKGILKAPREKFPEDPNTVREGVAPLDAAKKGIPPEARWTRVNRRLVNPEALEQEGVRFEEFPDHVIVLKVLSQEEINRFTAKTYEIRERRRLVEGVGAAGSGGGSE